MFKEILDKHRNGILILDTNLKTVYSNNVLNKIFNKKSGEKCGEFLECFYTRAEKAKCRETTRCSGCNIYIAIEKVMNGDVEELTADSIEYKSKINGRELSIELGIDIRKIEYENEVYVLLEFFKMKTQNELLISNKRIIDDVLDSIDDYIFYKDENYRYVYANKTYCDFIGISKMDILGKNDFEIFPEEMCYVWKKGDDIAQKEGIYQTECKDGDKYFKITKQKIVTDEKTVIACTIKDITYEKIEIKKAYTDSLTGLGNRHGYEKKIRELFIQSLENYDLAILDLDFLRELNNDLGHSIGDLALKKVSNIIINEEVVYAYRIGGDEFALLIDSKKDSEEICNRINKSIKNTIIAGVRLSSSIGITNLKFGESILKNFNYADKALYQSKNSGRGKVTYYKRK